MNKIKKKKSTHLGKAGLGDVDVLQRVCTGSFVFRVFICFLQVAILGGVSIRILTSFPGMSFNMHQSECIVRFGVIPWSASPLICLAVIGLLFPFGWY